MFTNRYATLTYPDMLKISEASFRILEKTGILIDHAGARGNLRDAGADVDDTTTNIL